MMHETARRSRVLPVQKRGGGEAVCTRGARGQEEEAGAAPDGAVCTRRLAREEAYATTRLASLSRSERGGRGGRNGERPRRASAARRARLCRLSAPRAT